MEAIKKEPNEIADTGFGEIVSCKPVVREGDWPNSLGTGVLSPNPLFAEWCFDVQYANGAKATLSARGFALLSSIGFTGADGRPYGNKRLVATVVKAIAACTYVPAGELTLVSEEEADQILKDCGVRDRPCDADEEWIRDVEDRWTQRWLDQKLAIRPDPDSPAISAKWWWAHSQANAAKAKADSDLVQMCDGSMRHAGQLSEAEKNLVADPDEPDDPWPNVSEPA